MRKYLLLIILIFPLLVLAQSKFSGIVKDSKTKETLPFATLITNTGLGNITDVDGKFTFNTKTKVSQLTVSYIGYKTQKITIAENEHYIPVFLEPNTENLHEIIVIAKENPALQIIRYAIANKTDNTLEKNVNSYRYSSYHKLIVTANQDSIQGTVDSIFVEKKGKRIFKKLDSTNYLFKKEIEKHHIYIAEKISEYKFKRGKHKKETILATRMAGFKNPIYEVLVIDLQSFSFYDEVYSLLGNKYLSPLANNALKKYNYKILDTISNDTHATFMVYFKPKKEEKKVGLEGVLYINTKSFALEKGIAELKGIVHVKAIQKYSYKPKYTIWFPDETQIIIRKGKSNKNINLFGGSIQFEKDSSQDSIGKSKQNNPGNISYLISKSKNFDIKINIPVKVINSASTIEIDDKASRRNEQFWNTYRTEPITKRDVKTYKTIDSLSEKAGIENKLNILRKISKGYFPSTYFDVDLSQLINFNNHEGFRLGFGAITNTDFSKKIKFEGYTAYGFNDKALKYHFGSSIRLSKQNNTWVGIGITNDIKEAAKLEFLFDDTSFSLINPRNFNISQFFHYKTFDINIQHDIFPNLETKFKFEKGDYKPAFDYQFIKNMISFANYNLVLGSFALQWTPFNKYMNSPIGKIAVKKAFPRITGQVTRAFDNISNGDLSFTQTRFKLEHEIKLINKSSTHFLIQGGYTFGDAPLTHLYNAVPNYSFINPWRRRINFSGTNAFETMGFNEFISDKYVSFQVRQNFTRFKIGSFKPRLSLITRYAIGTIDKPNQHVGITFKKMNKGYLESGFVLNHLFKGFGISSFYRYGAYSMPKFHDNLAVKLTYVLSLGF